MLLQRFWRHPSTYGGSADLRQQPLARVRIRFGWFHIVRFTTSLSNFCRSGRLKYLKKMLTITLFIYFEISRMGKRKTVLKCLLKWLLKRVSLKPQAMISTLMDVTKLYSRKHLLYSHVYINWVFTFFNLEMHSCHLKKRVVCSL